MKFVSVRGALLGALCLGATLGQAIHVAPAPKSTWPPEPEDMVYVDWKTQGVTFPVSLPTGSSLVAYEVPSDKWFVLTGYRRSAVVSQDISFLSVVEEFLGTQTVKIEGTFSEALEGGLPLVFPTEGQPLGVAFRPGSRVLLRNSHIDLTTPVTLPFAVAGYLVDNARGPDAWPPHPRAMVLVASENFPTYQPGTGIRIVAGELFTMYTVPPKKRFVLTGFRFIKNSNHPVLLVQDEPTGVSFKLEANSLDSMFGPPIGVVFDPGTNVVLTMETGFTDIRFGLSGYLADE